MTELGQRIAAQTGLARVALALAAGGVMALAQTPVDWPLAYFLSLPPLLFLLDGTAGRRGGFAVGWLAGVGYFTGTLFWIVEPFLVDPERHAWLAPFGLAGMVGGLALFWGAAFAIARRFWRPGASRILLLSALWTLAEMARTWVLTGFPWALLAYGWVETPVMQVAALTGPHLLGLLTLVAALLPALGSWRAAAFAAALVGSGWGWGAWRLAQPVPERSPPVLVRLVQPNADQREKWDPARQAEFHRRLLASTRAPGSPDVTIWPETAVPFPLDFEPEAQAEIAAAAGPEGRLILGMLRAEPVGASWDWVNALAVLDPDGAAVAVYDKHHLVPFGEYVPFGDALAGLGLPGLTTLTSTGFRAGPGPRVLEVEGLPRFLPLICYEAIFPQDLRAPGPRPEWLVQVTNDAWFGTVSGPYQHLAQARVRAIEQGLPLARAANTGISAMIDPYGRILASLPLDTDGHLDAELPGVLPVPAYARTGDLPGLIALMTVAGLTLVKFRNGVLPNARG
jgi:apolipoprotein N-acyltransferase